MFLLETTSQEFYMGILKDDRNFKGFESFPSLCFRKKLFFFFFFPVLVYGFDAQSDQMLV